MTKKENLTQKQLNVLKEIYEFIVTNNYPPSVRNIAEILGFSSPKGVSDHLSVLEKKGYILKNSSARSIRLTEKALWILNISNPLQDKNIVYLPLLGRIAAGRPIFAEENIEEFIPVSSQIMGKAQGQFLLKVKGDSMSGEHIVDGDTLIVKIQNTAENGDIVVALVDNEAVVKRFYKREDGVVELRSANPLYEPIIIKDNLQIQGKVIAIYRNIF
ncbi:MAG: transcriptional repressor LexA [Actinobacteria bacterium]|nr:transcriptional repressor LexA [Cyanobacteriota bacterium]MCL5772263.1 transcriptional repressor LexA [Actinomycetota bacterium]